MTAGAKFASFDDVLADIRQKATDARDLGARFEVLTKAFLKADKLYADRFSKVWLWGEWPERDGTDTGIDLIAEERADGSLCAIQCKCYGDDETLTMKAISTFVARASSMKIKHKMLVYTGKGMTGNAKKITKDVQLLSQEGLGDSSIDWSKYPDIVRKKPKELMDYQTEAVEAVLGGFGSSDRGKMIMACGTGKTLTSLHIAEKMRGSGKTVLYLVPSIQLIQQTMREWSENANTRHNYIVVCSDKTTGEGGSVSELESPVSTDPRTLGKSLDAAPRGAMTVVFCTYHSLPVVSQASKKAGLEFDLILCDEAHRTTGVEDKSFFTQVHRDSNVRGKRRLFMTATPRVYSPAAKAKIGREVFSMDGEEYGPEFYRYGFADAIRDKKLADFRVKIAIIPADKVDAEFQRSIAGEGRQMPLDELTLMAAIWDGLNYPDDRGRRLMQRAIAFTNYIDRSMMFAGEGRKDGEPDRSFESVAAALEPKWKTGNRVEVRHIDGKTKAAVRRRRMNWLARSSTDPHTCRILSNARCLTEGVDVPALDAVIFLNPKESKVDVVQAVGRVMRWHKDKEYGYVILPVAIPVGMEYHEALDDNKTFKTVWKVLNALRSHDENFADEINRLILSKSSERTSPTPRISVSVMDSDVESEPLTEFFSKIQSKLVEKVGDIDYYDKYGEKLGSAASTIEARIRSRASEPAVRREVSRLRDGLRELINDSIGDGEVIRTIAQHMVLARVFDALFQGEFASRNPVSAVLAEAVDRLRLDEELEKLEGFYAQVEEDLNGITKREERQNFIKKIYENFFKATQKKETEKHGIVYTPVEVVDFILHSVQDVLKGEFKTDFSDGAVKVLDPFAGTGTFLSRLIESGMLGDSLHQKYRHDMYANELMLLAYYVATVNVETTYSSMRKGGAYVPFEGMSYADTLALNPRHRDERYRRPEATKLDEAFRAAHARVRRQRESDLDVIVGNPPYSAGQSDFDDDNANASYPEMEERIRDTYLRETKRINPKIGLTRSLYDSYIQSLRWASDRIGSAGVIGLVTNASFVRSEVASGIRACLQKEFTDVWVFDLRGDAMTKGEIRKKESGNVFGLGSKTPVAITILVRNPKKEGCTIRYVDIGDYHTRDKKLEIVKGFVSISGIKDWQVIEPDRHHDWLRQRSGRFSEYIPMGSKAAKSGSGHAIFRTYSSGVKSGRDVWAYNTSKEVLSRNMREHIEYCNAQNWKRPPRDPKKAKWTGELTALLTRLGKQKFDSNKIRRVMYRPFFTQNLYFDRVFNQARSRTPEMFPEDDSENLVISVPYKFKGRFSAIITDITPDIQLNFNGQCFPSHTYISGKKIDNITDRALLEFQTHYNDRKITKKDVFYYVYGLLHHGKYRKVYANNLVRELPHIPMAPDFWGFAKTGKRLADLHLSWETCKRHSLGRPKTAFGKYEKMDYAYKRTGKKRVRDPTTLRINGVVAFDNIPPTEYHVNDHTPLEWAMDRYKRKVDKESGIVNDATDVDPIPLIERLVHVGLESDRLVAELPEEFEPKNWKPAKTGMDAHL